MDADTLVIDTVGFNDKTWLDATGKRTATRSTSSSATAARSRASRNRLHAGRLEGVTKPYTFRRVFTLAPGWDLQEYVCQAILDGIDTQ